MHDQVGFDRVRYEHHRPVDNVGSLDHVYQDKEGDQANVCHVRGAITLQDTEHEQHEDIPDQDDRSNHPGEGQHLCHEKEEHLQVNHVEVPGDQAGP